MALRFSKYHGIGNDFVIVDAREAGGLMSAAAATKVCDRHRGVGADGVLTLLPPRTADAALRMHLYNADGSEAQMCGNGLRCVIAYAQAGASDGPREWTVDTDAGLRTGSCQPDGQVRVSLDRPAIEPTPFSEDVEGEPIEGLVVSVGNPHLVVPAPDVSSLRARAERLGPVLERWPTFPDRTNVELVAAHEGWLHVVVHERGVGITQACGTGAGAAAAAAVRWGWFDPGAVQVRLPGGALRVDVDAASGELHLCGEAVHVFDGALELSEPDPV